MVNLKCEWMAIEILISVCGLIVILIGKYALQRSFAAYEKLSEERYRKVNALNIAAPGLLLIFIGILTAVLPLILQSLEKRPNPISLNVSVCDSAGNGTAEGKPASPSNEVSINLPVNQDMTLTPQAISFLCDTAKSLSTGGKAKISITPPDSSQAKMLQIRDQVVELLVAKGVKKDWIENSGKSEKSGQPTCSTGVRLTIQNGK